MADALETIRTRGARTPQREQAHPAQVPNSAGGFAFKIPGEARIHRFLTLGTDGTYYLKTPELTKDNAKLVLEWAEHRTKDLVGMAGDISEAGRAPKNDQAIFALAVAIALGDVEGRRYAGESLSRIVRTGEHLERFAKYLEQFRGWGPVARRAVAGWYQDKDPNQLAYQLVKYRRRHDWTHLDILRSAHPKAVDVEHDLLYAWVAGKTEKLKEATHVSMPPMVQAYDLLRDIERSAALRYKVKAYTQLVRDYPGVPWEALPDEATVMPEVMRLLLENGMPQTALIRQLPKLTRLGLLAPLSSTLRTVCAQLVDPERLAKARVHSVSVLLAAKTYASGVSARGDERWNPVPQVCDALTDAFYAAYGAVEPSNKRINLALDVSGSMGAAAGGLPITCREAATAVALVTAATEPQHVLTAFTNGPRRSKWSSYNGMGTGITTLSISARQRIDDAMRTASVIPMGGTDCALPMLWAAENKVPVDVFEVLTDNETWFGDIHPYQALELYRQRMGIDARLAVVSFTPTEFSIANPDDPRTLDVSGFDSATPTLLADFARGDI
jgi:60 kDa SS-A/Ro ribonucleoprotein